MSDHEIPITRIDPTTNVQKVADRYGRKKPQYRVGIRITVADGRTFEDGRRFDLKRDADAYLRRMPMHPTNMAALLDDDDETYIGYRVSYDTLAFINALHGK